MHELTCGEMTHFHAFKAMQPHGHAQAGTDTAARGFGGVCNTCLKGAGMHKGTQIDASKWFADEC